MFEFTRQHSSVELVELYQLNQVGEFGGAVVKAEEALAVLFTLAVASGWEWEGSQQGATGERGQGEKKTTATVLHVCTFLANNIIMIASSKNFLFKFKLKWSKFGLNSLHYGIRKRTQQKKTSQSPFYRLPPPKRITTNCRKQKYFWKWSNTLRFIPVVSGNVWISGDGTTWAQTPWGYSDWLSAETTCTTRQRRNVVRKTFSCNIKYFECCFLVCLFASRITQELRIHFPGNFLEGWGTIQSRTQDIFV